MHADPMSMTTASLVTRLPEQIGRRPWPVWISFATPCTGIFIPVYLDGVLPARLAAIGDANAKPGQEESAWEAMRRLQEHATVDFERAFSIVRDGWKELARSIELERLRVEQDVAVHYAANRHADGEEELTSFMRETTDRVIERAIQLEAAI